MHICNLHQGKKGNKLRKQIKYTKTALSNKRVQSLKQTHQVKSLHSGRLSRGKNLDELFLAAIDDCTEPCHESEERWELNKSQSFTERRAALIHCQIIGSRKAILN